MWALGCVLYEMCCLCVPFDGDSLQELILKILHEQYKAIPRSDFIVKEVGPRTAILALLLIKFMKY